MFDGHFAVVGLFVIKHVLSLKQKLSVCCYLNVTFWYLCLVVTCGLLLVMGYYKNIEVFGQVEEPDRERVIDVLNKKIELTVREWLTVFIGLSVSCIGNVLLILVIVSK